MRLLMERWSRKLRARTAGKCEMAPGRPQPALRRRTRAANAAASTQTPIDPLSARAADARNPTDATSAHILPGDRLGAGTKGQTRRLNDAVSCTSSGSMTIRSPQRRQGTSAHHADSPQSLILICPSVSS
jgi:hypothetical protein